MVNTRRSRNKRTSINDSDNDSEKKAIRHHKKVKLSPNQDNHEAQQSNLKKNKGKMKMTVVEEETSVDRSVDLSENTQESDEDSFDWEAIDIPVEQDRDLATDRNMEEKPTYKDVEIVMKAPRPILKQSNWERAFQRNVREWIHHSHVITLIAHYKIRNKWCSNNNVKSVCSSILPENAKRLLSKDNSSENALKTGIKWLIKWWSEFFTLTGPGLLTVPYNDLDGRYKGYKTLQEWIDSHESDENSDFIEDMTAFMTLFATKSGTRDTSAELFVALIRSCGCNARLICSLQPVSYRIPSAPSNSSRNSKTDEETEALNDVKKPLFQYRATSKAYVDPNIQLKTPKAKPPTVWVEVYATDSNKWISVDPIRGFIDKPLMMEPAHLDRSNSLSFVLAFDKKGRVTDVTRRYTSNMEKAVKLRERPLTKREMEGGMKLWSDKLLSNVCYKAKINEKDYLEQQELEERQVKEVMPTSISAFKNHPVYALERHLLKYEIIYPKDLELGSIRGETIYPRSSVKTVSTAETFRKAGRQIKEGEQPVKFVKANAFTIEKKRMKELAKQEGEDYSVSCYGEWQTEPYIAPPVINGILPKNSFGNIELFTASMLPKGAAHIPIKGIGKLAKKLGIDYADAVVDFEFVKMRAIPVIDGIVVADYSKSILLEGWEEHEQAEALKAIEKQEKDVFTRWRKLIKGLLIKDRVDREYGKKDNKSVEQKWATFYQQSSEAKLSTNENNIEGGGFIEEENDQNSNYAEGGGFIEEENGQNSYYVEGGGFLMDDDMYEDG